MISDLFKHFDFDDLPAVESLLKVHPPLEAALTGLAVVLKRRLPMADKPQVRVFSEPTRLESRTLGVSVPLDMGPIQARAWVEAIDNEWWMQLPPVTASLITFDVAYFKSASMGRAIDDGLDR